MLINISNHPSSSWGENQLKAANRYARVADLAFPHIDPEADTNDLFQLAKQYEEKIRKLLAAESTGTFAVHIMGELTFCFALVARLQKAGISCLASTTQRKTIDNGNGSKTVLFDFVRFREYPNISCI